MWREVPGTQARCMSAAVLDRPVDAGPAAGGPLRPGPVAGWWQHQHVAAQFARFVLVGGSATGVHVGLLLLLADLGDQAANLVGVVASTALANELHRRLTFRAGARTHWAAAQWAGGGLAATGLAASSTALALLDGWTTSAGPLAAVLVVCAVNGAVGLVRFAGLRWVLVVRTAAR